MLNNLHLLPDQNAFVMKAYEYARKCHQGTNHKYDGDKDYFETHVLRVVYYGLAFISIVPYDKRHIVIAMLLLHDCIEDCRVTYNDIKNEFGVEVAEGVYAVTNEKGKNRPERANAKYYFGIRKTPYAIFVKLADRLANVAYGIYNGGGMIKGYLKENPHFVASLKGTTFLQVVMTTGVKILNRSNNPVPHVEYDHMYSALDNMFSTDYKNNNPDEFILENMKIAA